MLTGNLLLAAIRANDDISLEDVNERVVTVLETKGYLAAQLDVEQMEQLGGNEWRSNAFK